MKRAMLLVTVVVLSLSSVAHAQYVVRLPRSYRSSYREYDYRRPYYRRRYCRPPRLLRFRMNDDLARAIGAARRRAKIRAWKELRQSRENARVLREQAYRLRRMKWRNP